MISQVNKYEKNPFTAHEGSGLGSCVTDLKKAYPKATFKEAYSIYGHDVRTDKGRASVDKWIERLEEE